MRNSSIALDNIRIATPCPVSWESMTGTDEVRSCSHCQLNVYNISSMTRADAAALIAKTEGRLCVRIYKRADGTLLTKDCPVGLRALRRHVSKRATAVFATLISVFGAAFGQSPKDDKATACTTQTRITRKTLQDAAASMATGTVVDANGAVIVGVTVSFTNELTKTVSTAITNDNGIYTFVNLDAGRYSIKLEAMGFQTLEIPNFEVNQRQAVNLDVTLQVSATTGVLVGVLIDTSMIGVNPAERIGERTYTGDHLRRLP